MRVKNKQNEAEVLVKRIPKQGFSSGGSNKKFASSELNHPEEAILKVWEMRCFSRSTRGEFVPGRIK